VTSRAYLAIGSGDSAGSAQAAFHLAQRGIHIYMPGDRYIGDLLGYEGPAVILGTAPIHFSDGRAVIGQQPVTIRFRERVVVGDAPGEEPGSPHDAPARYFRALAASGVPLDLRFMPLRDQQVSGIIGEAARLGATVIAVRVAHQDDYAAVKQWLAGAPERRVVLFHSAPYPTGYRLFAEFPLQVTFGDPRPRFETL
ncbi:MAG TPA: hypothetical protein VFL80_05070, partial [Thermoanaerobaculia bacterium]|nr:hypothetical protein [Thermoanaerobaculia bacterium]